MERVMRESIQCIVAKYALVEPPFEDHHLLIDDLVAYSDRVSDMLEAVEDELSIVLTIDIRPDMTFGDLVRAVETAMNQGCFT